MISSQRRAEDRRPETGGIRCRTSPSPPRVAGPSTIRSSAPARSSYDDSISPEFYELEREAIFRRTWLNVGRVEQLPKVGSYFTKELDAARTSIVVVRGTDGEVRAFHNICRHRGNKLVWTDYPARGDERDAAGSSPASTTAGATASTGELHVRAAGVGVLRPRQGRLRPRAGAGRRVGRVHLREPRSRRTRRRCASTSGELGKGLEGYPFHELTQVHKYRAEVGSNWKLFIDAFAEFYHAPILHAKQSVAEESQKLAGLRLRGAAPTASTVRTAWCRRGAGCRRRRT